MKKRIFYSIVQLWYQLTCPVVVWLEWQDAKSWAAEYRPAWLQLATKARGKETREHYREKIIAAYQECAVRL